MSSSQLLSSIMCISYLCSAANGFTPVFRPTTPTQSCGVPVRGHHEVINRKGITNLGATKGRSKAPDTAIASSSDKVKEMASFLSIQLLEKVMAEAMKPEGEGTMDLEAVERITQALQTTTESPSKTSTPASEATSDGTKTDDVSLSEEETPTMKSDETTEATLYAPPVTTETEPDEVPLPPITDSDSATIASEKTVSTETIPETVEEEVVPPVPEPVASAPPLPEIVRKPLEVIESNILPLRPESIPQRTDPIAEDEQVEETIEEVVVAATPTEEEKEEAIIEEESSPEEPVAEESDESAEEELERKKAQESFQRRLLQQKLVFDKKAAARIETEEDAEAPESNDEEETQKGEFTITDIVSPETPQEEPEPPKAEPESPNLTKRSSSSTIPLSELERRVETIVNLRQPKSTDEESKLAEKYGQMENLEDRAFTLLLNLGMIKEHEDPKDSAYDHSNDDDLCDQRYFPRM